MRESVTCGAKTRNATPCSSRAIMANGRCRMHGGSTPSGLALPQTIHGRHSRYLPTRLISRYEEAVADPELLTLKDDIALIDTRLSEVINALNTGESKQAWEVLAYGWGAFADGWKDMAPDDMEASVERISGVIKNGLAESYVWNEIRALVKERADLVSNERKRLVELQQYVTTEKALLFVHAVMASVKKHVPDQAALAAIAADLHALSDVRGGSEPAGPGRITG